MKGKKSVKAQCCEELRLLLNKVDEATQFYKKQLKCVFLRALQIVAYLSKEHVIDVQICEIYGCPAFQRLDVSVAAFENAVYFAFILFSIL